MPLLKRGKKNSKQNIDNQTMSNSTNQNKMDIENIVMELSNNQNLVEQTDLSFSLKELKEDFMVDHSKMQEITEPSVLARLNALVQGGTQISIQTAQRNQVRNAVKNTGELLQSDIPLKRLANVKGSKTKFRGFTRTNNRTKDHVELTKYDTNEITSAGKKTAAAGKVMNIASMIVGQYYMNEVNEKLKTINHSISAISSYQQREFKSRIMALIHNIQEISNFSAEILENQELRQRELNQLNTYKNELFQLLEQINITVQELVEEKVSKFSEYQSKVNEFEKLLSQQAILTAILEETSKLIYTLNLGRVSLAKSFSAYNTLLEHSNQSRDKILTWHISNQDTLEIDIENTRFKKQRLELILSKPLSLIDKKWNYKNFDSNVRDKILIQSQNADSNGNKAEDKFSEEVELYHRDGKFYYLHSGSLLEDD